MKSSPRVFILLASFFGFTAVALGAFAAHGLQTFLPPDMVAVFETGVRYQMYHSFALFAVACLIKIFPGRFWGIAGWCFTAGIVLFSGSLYVLALLELRSLGMVTPFGGLCFLAGWFVLGIGGFKIKKEN